MPSSRRVEAIFFTATILQWKRLLKPDKYKNVIVNSLRFLVQNGRISIYGFVIMDNHIHIVWHLPDGNKRESVQQSFLKYTAQQIKFDLVRHHPQVLAMFKVEAKDRAYQFWERNALSVDLWTESVLLQKLNYIHENPVRAGICRHASEYHYSSACFYETGVDSFGFLSCYER